MTPAIDVPRLRALLEEWEEANRKSGESRDGVLLANVAYSKAAWAAVNALPVLLDAYEEREELREEIRQLGDRERYYTQRWQKAFCERDVERERAERAERERDALQETLRFWWESKRPAMWNKDEQLQSPHTNCVGEEERRLADLAAESYGTEPLGRVGAGEEKR